MSVRAQSGGATQHQVDIGDGLSDATANLALGEGASGYSGASVDHPLRRNIVVSIRASLADLQSKPNKAIWSPNEEALKTIFQHRQFVSLQGRAEMQGNLKQIVMHSVTANSVKSSFPIAIGARISGVDENTFSASGASYSMVIPPEQHSNMSTTLQKDDVTIGTLTPPPTIFYIHH